MEEHSCNFEKVRRYYKEGLWTAKMVRDATDRWITQDETDEILGSN